MNVPAAYASRVVSAHREEPCSMVEFRPVIHTFKVP